MGSIALLFKDFKIHGALIPPIGLGTFQGGDGNSRVKGVVLKALRLGYRHIDTASAYGNERDVGEAIKECGIPRKDIFITTKLSQTWHHPNDVQEALERSLEALQLDYVDLYLMHFPHAYVTGPDHSTQRHQDGKPIIDYQLSRAYTQTWQAMEKLVDQGKTRMIGLSNFNILKTKRILEIARIKPAVNQVELHPYLPQTELIHFCKSENIHMMAHQPLGGRPVAVVNPNVDRPGPMVDAQIAQIASETETSPAQVLLSWAVQRRTSAVPKTSHEARLVENRMQIKLNGYQMSVVNNLASIKGYVRFLDPEGYIGFNIFDEDRDQPVSTEQLYN